jgi:SHAQKYF class myb-like DNA-binding protein
VGAGPKSSILNSFKVQVLYNLGLRIYGKNWKKIEQLLPNRTGSQIRSHAQKFFLKTKESEISNNLN